MEFELQLRQFYTQSNLSPIQRNLKRAFRQRTAKVTIVYYQHRGLSIAHFKCNHVDCFSISLFLGSLNSTSA